MAADPTKSRIRTPIATYRVQFNRRFTFDQATALIDYFDELGISDWYASPFLKARPGSLHGYDVVHHSEFNPEIGSEKSFGSLAERLHDRGMGILMDVVPNHSAISDASNRWWYDVLENGPSSPYARYFDIDWHPPKVDLSNKVLLPILGEQYGRALENQEIQISFDAGTFTVNYTSILLPLAPRSWIAILEPARGSLRTLLDSSDSHLLELESIITALGHLPLRSETDPEKVKERQREKEIIKSRLAALAEASAEAREAIARSVKNLNGTRGNPTSFDCLEAVLAEQAYRLSFWRVAADEINYRRFFDVNDLAAIRVEEPEVFSAVHELVFRLLKKGWVNGLRIDHVDGLYDPLGYLLNLQQGCRLALRSGGSSPRGPGAGDVEERPCYVVVEKILGSDEKLRTEWPVHGTTGYEFLHLLNGLFVDSSRKDAFLKVYESFSGQSQKFEEVLVTCKKFIMLVSQSSELHVLAWQLDRISEQHRWSRDFTLETLRFALREVIASFPVYRSYIRTDQSLVSDDDRRNIFIAVRAAKRRNPATSPSVFDFIGSILLLEDPKGLDEAQKDERRNFVMRFQQLTGPVMAKGLEDTAFYRYYPLASLNEVGGNPQTFGVPLDEFHRKIEERSKAWPDGLSASSTHDTKRSEDVRARINVLSEVPEKWERSLIRWRTMNADKKSNLGGTVAPDANEEYLLYQTLVGAWPFGPEGAFGPMSASEHGEFVTRIQDYMAKALNEAKVHTSWINPNTEYERGVREFIDDVLKQGPDNKFLADFVQFHHSVARAGMFNSLSQTLVKIASPGIPDFYQGTELWDFTLVDPDNRHPVDFDGRRSLLRALRDQEAKEGAGKLADGLMRHSEDGRIKLFLISRALAFRKRNHDLFARGSYIPLSATGGRGNHVVAFARVLGEKIAVAVVGRFFRTLGVPSRPPVGSEVWGETFLPVYSGMNPSRYRDVLTNAEFSVIDRNGESGLPLAGVFGRMPVALLEGMG